MSTNDDLTLEDEAHASVGSATGVQPLLAAGGYGLPQRMSWTAPTKPGTPKLDWMRLLMS